MLSDALLARSGDEIYRQPAKDPAIVELSWGGYTRVKVCACGKRRKSIPRNYADGKAWECTWCGRRYP